LQGGALPHYSVALSIRRGGLIFSSGALCFASAPLRLQKAALFGLRGSSGNQFRRLLPEMKIWEKSWRRRMKLTYQTLSACCPHGRLGLPLCTSHLSAPLIAGRLCTLVKGISPHRVKKESRPSAHLKGVSGRGPRHTSSLFHPLSPLSLKLFLCLTSLGGSFTALTYSLSASHSSLYKIYKYIKIDKQYHI